MTQHVQAPAFSISMSVTSTFTDLKSFADFSAKLQAILSGFGPDIRVTVPAAAPAVHMPTNLVTPAPLLEAIKEAVEAPAPVAGGPPADLAPRKGPGRPKKQPDAPAPEPTAAELTPAAPVAPATPVAPELPLPAPAEAPKAEAPAEPVTVSDADFKARISKMVLTKGTKAFQDLIREMKVKNMSEIPGDQRAEFLAKLGA